MKSNAIKIIVVFILITITLMSPITVVYAGFIDSARGESGPAPEFTPPDTPPSTPSEPSKPSEPSEPKPSEPSERPKIVYVDVYCKDTIEGNVYEDLGQIKPPSAGNDSLRSGFSLEGITVNLYRGDVGGELVASTVTKEDGSYSISPGSDGTYTTEFVFGKVSDGMLNSTALVKSALRYNGQDYYAERLNLKEKNDEGKDVVIPGGEEKDTPKTPEEIDIKEAGKGCAQVFIALDCSNSMRSEENKMTLPNGDKVTRLQVAVDATKELINSLLNNGQNIYIGLVFFSGTCYRAASLTKDIDLLNACLDDINSNGWWTHNTNIKGALDKVDESFYYDKENGEWGQNRYAVIVSDGVPTSDGNTNVYNNDSAEEIRRKIKGPIAESTRKRLQELRQYNETTGEVNGAKVAAIFVKSDDPEENEIVDSIFNLPSVSDIFKSADEAQDVIDAISDDIEEDIEKKSEEKEYTVDTGKATFYGYEDEARRQEVYNNFKKCTYGSTTPGDANTILFDLIDKYDGSKEARDKARELSDKTWMKVKGGTYAIETIPSPNTQSYTDSEGYTTVTTYHSDPYKNQDLYLARIPEFSLITKTTITALKITLSDGQMLYTDTKEVGSDLPIIDYIDAEIAHGATVEVEYSINVKNNSSTQCNYLEVINHLPSEFMFNGNTKLITENKTNSEVGWKVVSLQELYNTGYVSEETKNIHGNKISLKAVLDNDGKGENGFYIPPNGEYTLKLVTSKVASVNTIYELDWKDDAEILVYTNHAHRRMAYLSDTSLGYTTPDLRNYKVKRLVGVYPGDSKDFDCSALTNSLTIIPPTGVEKENLLITLLENNKLTITTSIAFMLVIAYILKKIIKRK